MCEEIQASGNFFISKTKDGKYRLKFTLFDNDSISVEQLQASQIMLLSFLLDLHQGRDCLDVGSLHIHNTREVQGVAHLSCGAEKARESVQVHKCAGDFVCYLQQKEYKWAEQVKKTFSEQDIRMLDYALTYVKKAGIAQFEEELLSIKQVFQTNNVHHSPEKRTEWLESLFRLREEARLAEGRLLQHQVNLLMIQDNLATLLKSLAFLEPTHELPEAVEGEINQTRKLLEDLTEQILS